MTRNKIASIRTLPYHHSWLQSECCLLLCPPLKDIRLHDSPVQPTVHVTWTPDKQIPLQVSNKYYIPYQHFILYGHLDLYSLILYIFILKWLMREHRYKLLTCKHSSNKKQKKSIKILTTCVSFCFMLRWGSAELHVFGVSGINKINRAVWLWKSSYLDIVTTATCSAQMRNCVWKRVQNNIAARFKK